MLQLPDRDQQTRGINQGQTLPFCSLCPAPKPRLIGRLPVSRPSAGFTDWLTETGTPPEDSAKLRTVEMCSTAIWRLEAGDMPCSRVRPPGGKLVGKQAGNVTQRGELLGRKPPKPKKLSLNTPALD